MKNMLLALCVGFSSFMACAQTPIVRVKIQPAKGIIVGQPVSLVVSVLVPNYFTGSPDFPEFEIENAIVVLPQDRPQNTNEKIGGVTYAGITETYTIYPQQPGDFRLPPAHVTVPYANAPPKTTVAVVPMPSFVFHADVPAAAQSLDYFLPTSDLVMQQKWSAPLKNLRSGDSIERTIVVTATRMQAMLIPPLPLEAPSGIRIYEEEPVVEDKKTDRGDFLYGRRVQSTKYLIQKAGDYTLPAIELTWWNLSTNRPVKATLPAIHFTAAENPNYVSELPPEPEPVPVAPRKQRGFWAQYKLWMRVIIPCFILFFILSWMGGRYMPRIYGRLKARQQQRAHSEQAYFHNLLRSCRQNDPQHAYDWLVKWHTLAHPNRLVEDFLREVSDTDLSFEIEQLGAILFREGTHALQWDGRKMAKLLKLHRKNRSAHEMRYKYLAKLNP